MKIKEKGLTGKSANHRRDLITSKKFDAFREMAKAKAGGDKKQAEEPKRDVYLEFLGHKLLIKQDEEGNGTIGVEDIPYVKGVTLKFDGCGGDVTWSEIKVASFLVVIIRTLTVNQNRIQSKRGLTAKHPTSSILEETTVALLDSTSPLQKKTLNLSRLLSKRSTNTK